MLNDNNEIITELLINPLIAGRRICKPCGCTIEINSSKY